MGNPLFPNSFPKKKRTPCHFTESIQNPPPSPLFTNPISHQPIDENDAMAVSVLLSLKDSVKLPLWKILRKVENYMGGSDFKMVIEKYLYASDVSVSGCRFSMPARQIKAGEFLTREEITLLNKKVKPPYRMPVIMIDTTGRMIEGMELRRWRMEKKDENGRKIVAKDSGTYNLANCWIKVIKSNGLKEGMPVQLWSFRIQSRLGFALARID